MPRLIDADKAKEVLTDYYHIRTDIQQIAMNEAFSRVPTVDAVPLEDFKSMERTVNKLTKAIAEAEPVRYGRWIREPNCWYRCSKCGSHYPSIADNMDYHYCPNCGVKMEGVKDAKIY